MLDTFIGSANFDNGALAKEAVELELVLERNDDMISAFARVWYVGELNCDGKELVPE